MCEKIIARNRVVSVMKDSLSYLSLRQLTLGTYDRLYNVKCTHFAMPCGIEIWGPTDSDLDEIKRRYRAIRRLG